MHQERYEETFFYKVCVFKKWSTKQGLLKTHNFDPLIGLFIPLHTGLYERIGKDIVVLHPETHK